jgi:protein phosphatase PTC7
MATPFKTITIAACRPKTFQQTPIGKAEAYTAPSFSYRQFSIASRQTPPKTRSHNISPLTRTKAKSLHTSRSLCSTPSTPRFTYGISASFNAKDRKYNPDVNVFNFNPYNFIQSARRKDKSRRPASGQDAFFVSRIGESRDVALGVADGVGGWVDSGVDPADFAHGFCDYMAHAAYTYQVGGDTPPYNARSLMQKGFEDTCKDTTILAGGSTACVAIAKGDGTLEVANLGDSGFMQLRLNAIRDQSEPQTHAFNTPYQLSIIPQKMLDQEAVFGGTQLCDLPKDANLTHHSLRHGDVLVFASDGCWDNLSSQDMLRIVSRLMVNARAWKHTEDGIKVSNRLQALTEGDDGQNGGEEVPSLQTYLAVGITLEAKAASVNTHVDGPFAKEVQKYYPNEHWKGGKVDDICVVVAIVVEEGK